LVERANFYGGNDNVTIVIFQYQGTSSHLDTDQFPKPEEEAAT
jgi:serine/threonine protein phosphatase PrpC